MSTGHILLLGAIAGGTIFFGLPMASFLEFVFASLIVEGFCFFRLQGWISEMAGGDSSP